MNQGLFEVEFKSLLKGGAGCGFRHLWQGFGDAVLGVINIREFVEK
jgi:hypothetical protein